MPCPCSGASRTEFLQTVSPRALFDGAREINIAGLSLNVLCQQYSDRALLDSIETGTVVKALFLDPSDARGVESPTLVIEKEDAVPGLFDTFSQVFDSMWDRAKETA